MGKAKRAVATTLQINITANAVSNLDEITWYIEVINKQPINAIKVGDTILAAIDKIAVNPHVYKEYEAMPTKGKIYRRVVFACRGLLSIKLQRRKSSF